MFNAILHFDNVISNVKCILHAFVIGTNYLLILVIGLGYWNKSWIMLCAIRPCLGMKAFWNTILIKYIWESYTSWILYIHHNYSYSGSMKCSSSIILMMYTQRMFLTSLLQVIICIIAKVLFSTWLPIH